MKNIRELTMGPPKTYKTGRVVNTYPKPMLVFEGDEGGLDVYNGPVQWCDMSSYDGKVNPLGEYCKKKREELPPILGVNFFVPESLSMNALYGPTRIKEPFYRFNTTFNNLFTLGCPWKTVVVDPVTQMGNMVLNAFAAENEKKMEDARKWAGAVGDKVKRMLDTIFRLPCHVVCIMHTAIEKKVNTEGQVISTTQEPVIYGKTRYFLGSLPSQFFFQDARAVGGQRTYWIETVPSGTVAGIGARWPKDLKARIENPTFENVYGGAVKAGETWQ